MNRLFLIAAVVVGGALQPVLAEPSAAVAGPQIYSMSISEGALSGPGADLLAARLPTAQFILIGEDHGFADSPEIALALAKAARQYGVNYHVVEDGPLIEEWAEEKLRLGGVDALGEALRGRPLSLAFLSRREDAALAEYFIDNAPRGRDVLWGVDQEFIGSPLVHFESLISLARTPAAKQIAEDALAAEKAAFAAVNLGAVFLSTATPERIAEFRTAFAGVKPALEIIDGLEASASIYGAYFVGRNFASNTDRIALMRKHFLVEYRKAGGKAPRALFKFGTTHLGKGTTFLNTFDLGSLTEGIAAANGLDALRILFAPLEGAQLQTALSPEGFTKTQTFKSDDVALLLDAIGVKEVDVPLSGYAVIAFEPVRRALEERGLKKLTAEQRFFILGYDYLVTTRGARPATMLAQ